MDNEIELISDGEGLTVIGDAADVEHFLASEGLESKDLGIGRLKSVAGTGAAVVQAASEAAATSSRWVKLTPESAKLVRKYGLRTNSKTGLSTGVIKGPKGQIKGFIELAKSPRSLLSNPAVLSGVAGIMAQLAMQQAMDEITDYLAAIDEKVDDVLQNQKIAVLSRMIGAEMVIDEALTLREAKGRVDGITWSKVQTAPTTIADTQATALLQLKALAEKMERKSIGDLAAAAKEAESSVRDWLVVLARCFQLQDGIAVLELDRVLDDSPEELDGHRLGLKKARQSRLEQISQCTEQLMARMTAAAATANTQVLLHPAASPAVVQSSNHVTGAVHDFRLRLGLESSQQSSEARQWVHAATEVRDKALGTGAKGVDAARSLGSETFNQAGSAMDKLSSGVAERARRWRSRERGDDEG